MLNNNIPPPAKTIASRGIWILLLIAACLATYGGLIGAGLGLLRRVETLEQQTFEMSKLLLEVADSYVNLSKLTDKVAERYDMDHDYFMTPAHKRTER